ncbi:sigma-70 family RNA polymerase sigma factor [Aquihabitans daechungensis]|uniref:sigma-70 family RNA polymerase sigma factor n=1 Tax=Aquihabitans daechungensis TaxID=1052257 RepID=UPI003BA346B1
MFRSRSGRSSRPHPPVRGDEDLTELAGRAAHGDRAAEEAFVARTIDDVWRYCRHLMGPAHADDATQATYLRALRSLGSFRGESSAKTWLIGVARNTCLDLRRTLARRSRLDHRLQAQPWAVADDLHADGIPTELEELLETLTPERREAFVLTQVLGFSYEAAAELIGVPVGTIRSRVARGRADLLDLVQASDPPDEQHA